MLKESLRRFQFPTGWNSTDSIFAKRELEKVSIPNGMEFYWILRIEIIIKTRVSIPNGIEFYKNDTHPGGGGGGFQFPTG